jgi:peptidoglycan-associated lipoprotein
LTISSNAMSFRPRTCHTPVIPGVRSSRRRAHPSIRIRIEGHADERGTREYNLALGERRADSVSRLLQLQGVLDDQIEILSYGEELPAASGHDERSWALNRRVEIVYGELYGER